MKMSNSSPSLFNRRRMSLKSKFQMLLVIVFSSVRQQEYIIQSLREPFHTFWVPFLVKTLSEIYPNLSFWRRHVDDSHASPLLGTTFLLIPSISLLSEHEFSKKQKWNMTSVTGVRKPRLFGHLPQLAPVGLLSLTIHGSRNIFEDIFKQW